MKAMKFKLNVLIAFMLLGLTYSCFNDGDDSTAEVELGYLHLDFTNGKYVYKPTVLEDSDETFDYTIRDGDGDVASDTATLHIGVAETIEYNGTDAIDGHAGTDTMVLTDGLDIDFSQIDSDEIKNIEIIDLVHDIDGEDSGDHKLNNITLSDILDMVDETKDLKIFGDDADEVDFKDEDGKEWSKSDDTVEEDGHTFDVYTNSGDADLVIKVEVGINDNII